MENVKSEEKKKNYLNGIAKQDEKYPDNVSIGLEEAAVLAAFREFGVSKNDKRYLNLVLKKRKEVDKVGNTHYFEILPPKESK